MPVRGRRKLATLAIESFLTQTYPEKELIILEDLDEPTFAESMAPVDSPAQNVFWLPGCEGRPSIPDKLNTLIKVCDGEIIIRWDSDDWSAPGRIAAQVERIQQSGKAVTGYKSMFFWDVDNEQLFDWRNTGPDYCLGTSLCFTREWAAAHPFPTQNLGVHNRTGVMYGEDGVFSRKAFEAGQLDAVDAGALMVARIHEGCSFPKNPRNTPYRRVFCRLPEGFHREVQIV